MRLREEQDTAYREELEANQGTPFAEDQGIYNRLTWGEQIDSGKQLTCNIKFLIVVLIVLLFFLLYPYNGVRITQILDGFLARHSLVMGKLPKEPINYDSDDEEGNRGETTMQIVSDWRKDQVKKVITFNLKGQPSGEYKSIFMSYLAVAICHHCGIAIQDWRENWVLKHCGERLKTFRSYLKKEKLYKSDGSLRLEKPHRYDYISQEDWDAFVKYHTSPEFILISEQNSSNHRKNKYDHNLSRQGYAGLEEMLV